MIYSKLSFFNLLHISYALVDENLFPFIVQWNRLFFVKFSQNYSQNYP